MYVMYGISYCCLSERPATEYAKSTKHAVREERSLFYALSRNPSLSLSLPLSLSLFSSLPFLPSSQSHRLYVFCSLSSDDPILPINNSLTQGGLVFVSNGVVFTRLLCGYCLGLLFSRPGFILSST
jgi:hypothetical protein